MTRDELFSKMGYHALLRGLLMAMDKPGRERTIGHIDPTLSGSDAPQMIFAQGEDGPVTSITLPPELLFALANSTNLRMLIEDEILKCEEVCEKDGLDIHVEAEPTYTEPQRRQITKLAEAYHSYSTIRQGRGFDPNNKPRGLRHYGHELTAAQKATGVTLVSAEEMAACIAVADAAVSEGPRS